MSRLAGPIRVSDNRRYFVEASGTPFFWLGDTAWPLFSSYGKDEAEAYLRDRASRGFTVIQCVIAWGDPKPEIDLSGSSARANCNGDLPWDGGPSRPNDPYFRHVDYLVDLADQLGLVMAILPTSGYSVTNSRLFDETTAFNYGQWVGRRYRDRANVVWINGCDRDARGFEAIWRALAKGLRDGDGGSHMITYHPCGWRSSSYYFHDDDWLDFNMIETWTDWMKVHDAIVGDYCLTPAKPVVLGEGAYENGPEYPYGPITPLVIRRQAWSTVTGGGFFTYGQDQMWRMAAGWTSTFDTPGARQMTILKQIVTGREWWKLSPDQSMLGFGISSEKTLNTAMRTKDRRLALIYFGSQTQAFVNIDRIDARLAKCTWYNPATGEQVDASTHETGNYLAGQIWPRREQRLFAVPARWEDAVLVIEAVS